MIVTIGKRKYRVLYPRLLKTYRIEVPKTISRNLRASAFQLERNKRVEKHKDELEGYQWFGTRDGENNYCFWVEEHFAPKGSIVPE